MRKNIRNLSIAGGQNLLVFMFKDRAKDIDSHLCNISTPNTNGKLPDKAIPRNADLVQAQACSSADLPHKDDQATTQNRKSKKSLRQDSNADDSMRYHPDSYYPLGVAAHTYEWVLVRIREEISTLRDVEVEDDYLSCQSHYYCDNVGHNVVPDVTCGVVSVQSFPHHYSFLSSLPFCEEGGTNWERIKAKGFGGKVWLAFLRRAKCKGLSAVGTKSVGS